MEPVVSTTGPVSAGDGLGWTAPRELFAEVFSHGVFTKLRVIRALDIPAGARVLDVGTGRGMLPLLLLDARSDITVVGVDSDLTALRTARRNAARTCLLARFSHARAEQLPFPPGHFDVVLSTLTLHHLPSAAKASACREFARVLRPDGTCYVADFARPRSAWARGAALLPRLTCFRHIGENLRGRIPALLREVGFHVEELFQTASSISLFRARLMAMKAVRV